MLLVLVRVERRVLACTVRYELYGTHITIPFLTTNKSKNVNKGGSCVNCQAKFENIIGTCNVKP